MKNIPIYTKLSECVAPYEGLLIDLWGVIHDGIAPYKGAKECLYALRKEGKRIILISNAPRRASRAKKKLDEMGIPEACYDALITSGEVTYGYIKSGNHSFGPSYMIIGPERDADLLDGLPYTRTMDASQAGFAILTGIDTDDSTLDEKMPELQAARHYNLPMICANPDMVIVRQSGQRVLCAGALAKAYEHMGGTVAYFGKPYPTIYTEALALLKIHDLKKIAAIGDNLDTDIEGANHLGIDTYLVTGGILHAFTHPANSSLPCQEKLYHYCHTHGTFPSAALPAFLW